MPNEIDRELLSLKAAATALNQKANALMVAVELIVEYRQLTSRLLGHADATQVRLNEIINAASQPVPAPTRQPAASDSD